MPSLATPCDKFALKLTKQKRKREKNKILKSIIKDKGIAFANERYYICNESIAYMTMIINKVFNMH
jgi:hypothetical protein